MCRYYYGEGRCANPRITEGTCIGQEDCDMFSMAKKPEESDCDTESWYGLYCAKYKRFFCPGKDSCETYEDYSRSFRLQVGSKDSR